MLNAIRTTYLGPTSVKGARMKAVCGPTKIYRPYDYELSDAQNHLQIAAEMYNKELGCDGEISGAKLGDDWVWVEHD
jgi:hypothetical protein